MMKDRGGNSESRSCGLCTEEIDGNQQIEIRTRDLITASSLIM